MDKLTMAHEMALAIQKSKLIHDMELVSEMAWKYADAMRAEADKRKPSGVPEAIRSLTKDNDGNCLHFHHEFGHKNCMDCGASLEQWQPDWSQAPEWANWWAMDSDGDAYWHSCVVIPFISSGVFVAGNPQGHTFEAPSFNYQGDWKDSLRKRPASEYSGAIKTQQNITAAAQYQPFMGNGYIDPLKTDDKTCKHELRDLSDKYKACKKCDYIETSYIDPRTIRGGNAGE